MRLRSIPATPPTAARHAGMQHRRTVSRRRSFVASAVRITPTLTNTPHVTSFGPGWPFTRKTRENKLMVASYQ
jgi:hypothetical protein